MKNKHIDVSIVIVNYKVKEELLNCITSIIDSRPKTSYEIIVVDNDIKSEVEFQVKRKFAQVKYIRAKKNIGFGAGNNLGAKFASGKYLFFLNPDTIVKKDSIDELFKFIKSHSESGAVAPLLFDPAEKVYPTQGSDRYNIVNAIITLSFVNKFFPNNSISRKFFHRAWTKKVVEEFDVVPGTAFMISKDLFEKIGMFDEKIFLYFEEYDLAERIRALDYKNYIIPKAKILHVWEASTRKRKDIGKIFSKSRNYFFKKHYGKLTAFIVDIVSYFGKYEFLLGIALCLSLFLNLYKINELMVFSGDQGWFYLSARDILISGKIPLVGIASSHPWLHQGPFWTYLLALFLWMFKFNPVSGAYLSIALGALSVFGIYMLGTMLFSKRTGLLASLLYATSPLAVYYMRLSYHTSPIPLFVIIFIIFIYKLIKGNINYLPLAILSLTILYNFEIATSALWGIPLGMLVYMLFTKNKSLKRILKPRIMLYSSLSLLGPLVPIILYDVKNGFPQTFKFIAWIGYRIFSLFGYNSQHVLSVEKISAMLNFFFSNFTKLTFPLNGVASVALLAGLVLWLVYLLIKKKAGVSINLLFALLLFPFILVMLNQVPSDAYLPIFFPVIIVLLSSFFTYLLNKKNISVLIFILIAFIVFCNVSFMFKNDFAFDNSFKLFTLNSRVLAAKKILYIAKNKDYNLIGKGEGSKFASFTMNYEYLTWWLGCGPTKNNEAVKIYISESLEGIKIEKSE